MGKGSCMSPAPRTSNSLLFSLISRFHCITDKEKLTSRPSIYLEVAHFQSEATSLRLPKED